MAITAIWDVKGWLGKVVIYVENPDKTENPAFFEQPDMSQRKMYGFLMRKGFRMESNTLFRIARLRMLLRSSFMCRASTALPLPHVMK